MTILGYGAMELRGQPRGPAIADEDAGRLLNAVLDAGINLIDTSIDYGRSEELIGRTLGHRRDEYFLASKCGCLLGEPPPGAMPPYPHDYSAGQHPRRGRAEPAPAAAPTASTSSRSTCRRAGPSWRPTGRSRRWSRCGTRARSASSACPGSCPNLPDQIAMGVFDVFQIPYSALQREHEDLITAAARPGPARSSAAARRAARRPRTRAGSAGRSASPRARASAAGSPRGSRTCSGSMSRHRVRAPLHAQPPGAVERRSSARLTPEHLRANVAVAERGPLPAELYEEAKRRLDPAARSTAEAGA